MPPGPEGPGYKLITHVKIAKEAGVDWKGEPCKDFQSHQPDQAYGTIDTSQPGALKHQGLSSLH